MKTNRGFRKTRKAKKRYQDFNGRIVQLAEKPWVGSIYAGWKKVANRIYRTYILPGGSG